MGTDDLLVDRGKTHGNWADQAETAAKIKYALQPALGKLPAPLAEALSHIAVKLSRIANGNAMEPDHFRDIAGYARLAEQWIASQRPGPVEG
jgi:L-rhamnose isomerase